MKNAEMKAVLSAFLVTFLAGSSAVAQKPDAVAAVKKAQMLQKQGSPDEAVAELKKAVQLDNTYWLPHKLLGKIYFRQKKYGAAAVQFEQAVKLNPSYQAAYYNSAYAYRKAGDYAKAIENMDGVDVDSAYILRCDKKTGKFECVKSENFELDFDAFLAAQRLRRRLKVLSKKRK